MLRTNFNEGVERARRNVQSKPLLKEASHVTVSLPLATQFPDQVAMGFQLGAWRFGREIGKSLKNDLRVSHRGGRKRMHRYPAGRPKSPAHDQEQVVGRIVGDLVGRPQNRSPLSPQYPVSSHSQGYLRVSTRALLSDTYRNLGSLITQRSLVQIQPPQPKNQQLAVLWSLRQTPISPNKKTDVSGARQNRLEHHLDNLPICFSLG